MNIEAVIPRPEYPRPSMVRPLWQNLNGEWQFEEDNSLSGKERHLERAGKLSGKIIVPFAPESVLSGIGDTDFINAVWYKRTFRVTEEGKGKRVVMRFGAVDYHAEVWINGTYAGEHFGGYTPFCFDITSLISEDKDNEITVYARDDVRSPLQPTGKQSVPYANAGCSYTRTTGIWQTVWIEYLPDIYITHLKLTPDVDNDKLHISFSLNKAYKGEVRVFASLKGEGSAATSANIDGKHADFSMAVREPALWSPDCPTLYDIEICVAGDCVTGYFGMRKVGIKGYAVELNGKPLFQRLVLDQGFFPDGIYTAPTDEALKNDILLSKSVGFNGARMHMKIFEPRYIYWADKLGYLLWGEYPNWGLDESDPAALFSMLPEWMEEVQRDYNSPAIVGWCPFNETGPRRLKQIYYAVMTATRLYDPIRPMIDTSGYVHGYETDIFDVHNYEQDPVKFASFFEPLRFSSEDASAWKNYGAEDGVYRDQPYMVSEYGGTHWAPEDSDAGWGYGNGPKDIEAFYKRYEGLTSCLLSHPKMCGFCYTQLTDVFQEKNGIFYFDRKEKFDAGRLYEINTRRAAIEE